MNISSIFPKKKTEKIPHCSAVILGAGNALRMGTDKMLYELEGMPVLARTLRVFESSELVDEIVVVTRSDLLETVADLCKNYNISKVSRVISGGSTRTESALAGVSEVSPKAKLIAIHDGARPFVTADLILRTVYAADEYLAAAPVIASTDTLKAVDDKGFMLGTVDREHTVRVQTPQIFKAELIKAALTRAVEKQLTLTDDCSAMEILNVRPHTVQGDEDNIKLTTPRDLLAAQAILHDREKLQ